MKEIYVYNPAAGRGNCSCLPENVYYIGDADLDSRITIKDATIIQKYIAKLVDLVKEQRFLANVDGDTKISIKDVTQIQKYVAGFKDVLSVGSEVKL